jgi:hypothetical protein
VQELVGIKGGVLLHGLGQDDAAASQGPVGMDQLGCLTWSIDTGSDRLAAGMHVEGRKFIGAETDDGNPLGFKDLQGALARYPSGSRARREPSRI